MTTRKYRWLIWGVLGLSFPLMHYFGGGEVGFSAVSTSERTIVSASTHPTLLLCALIAVGAIWALSRKQFQMADIGTAGLARRFLSLVIDLYLVVLVGGSFLAFIPLLVEANRTVRFFWSFTREYSVATDKYIFAPMGLVSFFFFVVYIGLTLTNGRPSLGEFLTGTIVRSSGGDLKKLGWRMAFKRMFWAALGAGLWPYTLLRRRDKDGRTWYDRLSGCDVTHVDFR